MHAMGEWHNQLDSFLRQHDENAAFADQQRAEVLPKVIPFLERTVVPVLEEIRDHLQARARSVQIESSLADPRSGFVVITVRDSQERDELMYRIVVDTLNDLPELSVRYQGVPIAVRYPAAIGMHLEDITQDDIRDNFLYHYHEALSR